MIDVKEMVKTMRLSGANNKPKPFSLTLVTADRKRNTGGRVLDIPRAILLTKKRQSERMLTIQPVGTKDMLSVHLDLILYFNKQEVA